MSAPSPDGDPTSAIPRTGTSKLLAPSAVVADMATFAREEIASWDIDPVYPILRVLEEDDEPEAALWRTLVFVAYYNLASSESALTACRLSVIGVLPIGLSSS